MYDTSWDEDEQLVDDIILYKYVKGNLKRKRHGPIQFRLNPDIMDEEEFVHHFRFKKEHIERLCMALNFTQPLDCASRLKVCAKECMLILLRRLAYPNRLTDLAVLFGRSPTALSSIANCAMKEILSKNENTLKDLKSLDWLSSECLEKYAKAIAAKGAPLQNCWGFIDGTARAICRPSTRQEEYYSGHKRYHCLKYQGVATPDGLIINLDGPYPGRRHDAGILAESNLYSLLEEKVSPYVIYGDPAYPVKNLLLAPYPITRLKPEERIFNSKMSTVRQAVEWAFGKVLAEFAFIDFKKNQKLLLQEVSNMYHVAILLTNCHTCLYGSQVSQYFEIAPPQLETYLGRDLKT